MTMKKTMNIANLVSAMYKNKGKGENWNKVVLVPVPSSIPTSLLP